MKQDMYREEILEHFRDPLNFGKPPSYTHSSALTNPFCGDALEIFLMIQGDTVSNAAFTGLGCAISIAGASLLTEYMKGKKVSALTKFTEQDMLSLLGIEVSESRKKCALLAFAAIRDAIP